jgi:hypothetical protein
MVMAGGASLGIVAAAGSRRCDLVQPTKSTIAEAIGRVVRALQLVK